MVHELKRNIYYIEHNCISLYEYRLRPLQYNGLKSAINIPLHTMKINGRIQQFLFPEFYRTGK